MDTQKITEIYNKTFAGLTLFYRDVELDENLIQKYQTGQILEEKGFTDISYKGGGITTNLRYLIASSFAKDVSSIMPDTVDCGRVMLSSGSYFKVIDIYKIGQKTQICLLNILKEDVDFFYNAKSNIEDEIVQKARESFDTKIKNDPIPELQSQMWKDITNFPIGMSDSGEFFYSPKKKPSWKFWK